MVRGRVRTLTGVAMALAIMGATMSSAGRAGERQPAHFVVKDSRNIGPNSVRFAAAQGTQEMPNIVLLGGDANVWPRIRSAVQEAEIGGYPVRAILVGPPSASPALEIYAHGHHVTNPIDPYRITKAELVQLLRDIHREYYPRR